MGRSFTPKYALYLTVPGLRIGSMAWSGRVSDALLAEYVRGFEASAQPGGANEHLRQLGVPVEVAYAEIRRNVPGGHVVAAYTPAARAA